MGMGVVSVLAGALVTSFVGANIIAFRRFRNKYLPPLDNPLDESQQVLATFDIGEGGEDDDGGFFFGLATAPAHVEDKLHDAWLEFAQNPTQDSNPEQSKLPHSDEEESHNVAAWNNVYHPEERLRFWSDPDTELRLAKDTGVTVFRMGVDWTRIMPVEPIHGIQKSVNWAALKRYKWIIERVHAYGMRVMLTLFHHSLPPWAGAYGGWKLEKTANYFLEFTKIVVEDFANLVDYWITFNEPHVFALLTYCAGAWPGGHPNVIEVATAALPKGVFNQVMHWMCVAHSNAFDHIHEFRYLFPTAIHKLAA